MGKSQSTPAAERIEIQPLLHGGRTASLLVQNLTLWHFTEARCNQTPSNEPNEHQPGGSQPSVNPTRDIHMGELVRATPMQPLFC